MNNSILARQGRVASVFAGVGAVAVGAGLWGAGLGPAAACLGGVAGGAGLYGALWWQRRQCQRVVAGLDAELETLRTNEVWYWLLAESVDDVVWVMDPEALKMLYLSPSVKRLRGYSPDEVAAGDVLGLLAPDSAAQVREVLPQRIRNFLAGDPAAVTWRNEIRLSQKNGGYVWAEVSSTLVRQPQGGLRLIGVSRNIDARKSFEEQLRASEARFRSVVEAAPEAVLVEAAGVFAYVNPAAVALLGAASPMELLGRPVRERFGSRPELSLLERFAAASEDELVRCDGSPVAVEGVAVAFRFGETDGALAFVHDMTARNRARAALHASEVRFRELAETINEVFWVREADMRRTLYVSPAFGRIWGADAGEWGERWTELVHAEDRGRLVATVSAAISADGYHETFRIVRPDGGLRWLDERAFPVRDEQGVVLRVVGVTRDITEQKRIEAQFLRAQRMEAIGALAAGVAHDLNNILTPVLITAGALKGETEHGHNRELVSLIEQSARRGAEVIRQLLAFSRGVDGERMLLQPRHLIREMATIVCETFPRTIALELELPSDLWPVEANSTQLHQVLINLCVNARDAMPGGGRLRISTRNFTLAEGAEAPVAEMKAGDYTVIDVSDTGIGMDAEVIAKVFDPFFTTKDPGRGTGLGLSTALGIVRSHGGHIGVSSVVGRGSRFSVYFPARRGEGEEVPAEEASPAWGHGELLLVVDDEFSIRETLRLLLQKHGYRVAVARDGEAALSLALQHAGTLRGVVTDVMMPGMDGATLVRALRSLDPTLALVVASGLDNDEKRAELTAQGVSDVLPKPCAADALLAAIHRALEAKKR